MSYDYQQLRPVRVPPPSNDFPPRTPQGYYELLSIRMNNYDQPHPPPQGYPNHYPYHPQAYGSNVFPYPPPQPYLPNPFAPQGYPPYYELRSQVAVPPPQVHPPIVAPPPQYRQQPPPPPPRTQGQGHDVGCLEGCLGALCCCCCCS